MNKGNIDPSIKIPVGKIVGSNTGAGNGFKS